MIEAFEGNLDKFLEQTIVDFSKNKQTKKVYREIFDLIYNRLYILKDLNGYGHAQIHSSEFKKISRKKYKDILIHMKEKGILWSSSNIGDNHLGQVSPGGKHIIRAYNFQRQFRSKFINDLQNYTPEKKINQKKVKETMTNKKYHYIYIIVNFNKNMLYVGKHSTTNLEDGYFGSGTQLNNQIQKYGSDSFYRYIIDFTDSEINLALLEKYYIQYFLENFDGVILNRNIPLEDSTRNFSVNTANKFWEKSYAFLYLINDPTDKYSYTRPLVLGSYFITGLFEYSQKDFSYYNWKDKNLYRLKNINFTQKQRTKVHFDFMINAKKIDLYNSYSKYDYILPFHNENIKVELDNCKFSEKNWTGYFTSSLIKSRATRRIEQYIDKIFKDL